MVVRIEPDALYDDVTLATELAVSERTLRDARRRGDLRFARRGQRILYLGQWVIDWISAGERRAAGQGPAADSTTRAPLSVDARTPGS
jgi:hypothetical protein